MPRHVYVYYRPADGDDPVARAAVATLLDRVAGETGVRGRWMRRVGGPATWMEVYEGVPDPGPFVAAVARLADAVGLTGRLGPGAGRHVEIFED